MSGLPPVALQRVHRDTDDWVTVYLRSLVSDIGRDGVVAAATVVDGRPSVGILQYAGSNAADLPVICTRGRSGFRWWLMGGVADSAVREPRFPCC